MGMGMGGVELGMELQDMELQGMELQIGVDGLPMGEPYPDMVSLRDFSQINTNHNNHTNHNSHGVHNGHATLFNGDASIPINVLSCSVMSFPALFCPVLS